MPALGLLLLALLPADVPQLPTAAARAIWLADLDPARVAELAVPGPLPAAGRLQSFSVSVRRIAFLTAVV